MSRHTERCLRCKRAIKKLLTKIFGKVEENYKFSLPTNLKDFKNTPCYSALEKIYETLKNYRGFENFIRAKTLPRCDFFVPTPGFIVEFDESQHFTLMRKIALEHYPKKLKLGFNKEKWISLCKKINARDNNPPYRDEQRAWYDTLRDFLPLIKNLKPTVRLFAGDFIWCSFNPDNPSDVKKFKDILGISSKNLKIELRKDSKPFLGRIIIANKWDGKLEKAKKVLKNICEKWPKGEKVKFLITCGGFIQFPWPKHIKKSDIGDNLYPDKKILNILIKEAKRYVKVVLDEKIHKKLKGLTDYITFGIDSQKEKISITKNYITQPHIELVCLVNFKNGKFYWAGKSYPTPSQQNGLVRIPNLRTHFCNLDSIGKVMILGCHDLTIFNPRSKNAKGWRKRINDEFKKLAQRERPIYVLHHPHTTVKKKTWLNAWSCLKRIIPSVRYYASAGRYFEANREQSEYDTLNEVLESTKSGNTIDFIIWE